jgi:glycosyltransferase involved in cell wall biosynthesis
MIKILHILDKIAGSGPTRSLISAVKIAKKLGLKQQHKIIALNKEVYPFSFINAKQAGITVIRKPSLQVFFEEIEKADIVQVHFWNNPGIYEFLRRDKPSMRLLIWYKILGDAPPQIITEELLDYSDFTVATSLSTLQLPVFKNIDPALTDLVYGIADWDRLANIKPKSHEGFNVGYIGTVNFAKMHPNYIPMSASVEIPNVKIIVCGGGIEKELQNQTTKIDAADKFEFRGYVENIKPILEILDVFGYPLCEDTYATSEKSLQEAMYAGIPPVVFPYGGIKHLVKDMQTGLVVSSELEYKQAIEFLYHNPNERLWLGENAREFALKHFNSEHWVLKLHDVYERMIQSPKHRRSWKIPSLMLDKPIAAELFIQSLGMSAPQFQVSYTGINMQELLVAEAKIAESSVLLTGGEGGIMQYRNYYPDDPHLRLWSGLALQQHGRHSTALSEFSTAIKLGCNRPSTYWHLYKSAINVNDFQTAADALIRVTKFAPDFKEAKECLSQMKGEISDSNNPLISIIIPVYNSERFIRDAIASIINDKYLPKEIIVVNDGSTDNTPNIVSKFPNIILISRENRGVAIARNAGIESSTGEYIAFLDSDDIWMPGRIEKSLNYFSKHPEIDFIHGQQVMFLENGVQKPNLIKQEWLEKPMDACIPGTLMLKKTCFEKIGLFNPEYKTGEDTEWLVRAKEANLKMARIPLIFLRRRIHDSNISLNYGEKPNVNLLKIMRKSIHRKKAH